MQTFARTSGRINTPRIPFPGLNFGPDVLITEKSAVTMILVGAPTQRALAMTNQLVEVDNLITVATSSTDQRARMAALEKLSGNEQALLHIAYCEHEDVAYAAANKLAGLLSYAKDAETFRVIALKSSDQNARKAAVEKLAKLDSKNELVHVAIHGEYDDARLVAVENLKQDATSLLKIFHNSKHDSTKEAITEQLASRVANLDNSRVEVFVGFNYFPKNLSVLAHVAKYSKNYDARMVAVEKLKGERALFEVASESKYQDAIDVATEKLGIMIEKIIDVNVLKFLAINSKKSEVRTAAACKLHQNIEALKEVARTSKYEDSVLTAISVFTSHIDSLSDVGALMLVAAKSENERARLSAVNKLSKHSSVLHWSVHIQATEIHKNLLPNFFLMLQEFN